MQESERIFIAENATLLRGSERELNRQLFTILNSIYEDFTLRTDRPTRS